jgi:hypothetical protein
VHGTCLGFEALAIVASANHSILSEFDAENLPSSLFLTDAAADGKSRFFNSLPPQVVQHLQTRPYAMENHSNGGSPGKSGCSSWRGGLIVGCVGGREGKHSHDGRHCGYGFC